MSNNNKSNNNKPQWAGPPDHVNKKDGKIKIGPNKEEKEKEKAINGKNQMDRIEAKLDLLLNELL